MTAAQQAAAQATSRVSTQVRDYKSVVPATLTPTIAQVAVAQAQNISNLRTILEDLAKGVIELSKVVGTHTKTVVDLGLRIDSIEQELGVEIDPETMDGNLVVSANDELANGREFVDDGDEYYNEQALSAEGHDNAGDGYDDDQSANLSTEEAA